jgi:predicted transcriptional regulator
MKIFETRESLKDKDLEIFNLLLDGKQASEIVEITKLSKSEVYRIFDKIKGILRD